MHFGGGSAVLNPSTTWKTLSRTNSKFVCAQNVGVATANPTQRQRRSTVCPAFAQAPLLLSLVLVLLSPPPLLLLFLLLLVFRAAAVNGPPTGFCGGQAASPVEPRIFSTARRFDPFGRGVVGGRVDAQGGGGGVLVRCLIHSCHH